MIYDTSTPAGQDKRMTEIVRDYTANFNWRSLVRLIGGSPRYDLADYADADAGEAPKGAEWN